MATKQKTYEEAMTEIDEIINNVEAGEISIDNLANELKRAKKLFDFCRKKLTETQEIIDKIVEE